jgi:hypothetical protein
VTVIAVDWSGRRAGERRYLWMAEAAGGTLLRLESGRTREEVVAELVARATDDPPAVVGFDFSFSLPAWFLDRRGLRGAPELWAAAAVDGERWLRECAPPFWGRPGRRRPDGEQLRATEAALAAVGGIRPKSTFQIGGAGSVGTGSVRGWPALVRLREAGFAIWPFDVPACPPVAVEIYPRVFTGPVVKSSASARAGVLDARYPALPPGLRDRAVASEDAFDAAVSALAMSIHEDELRALPRIDDEMGRREGRVWTPTAARDVMSPSSPVAAS